jgi:hypothetical protein
MTLCGKKSYPSQESFIQMGINLSLDNCCPPLYQLDPKLEALMHEALRKAGLSL